MATILTRRAALKAGAGSALTALLTRPFARLADDSSRDLRAFVVRRSRAAAGLPAFLPMSIRRRRRAASCRCRSPIPAGNQNFDTFDTLNIYSWKGDGAAGMSAHLRHADDRQRRRAGFRLWPARASRSAFPTTSSTIASACGRRRNSSTARGSRAADVAFSLNILKEKGHPSLCPAPEGSRDCAAAEGDDVVHVRFVKNRSRDAHLIVVGMPVFSAAWWKGRDFAAATLDAPLGSGAYKVKTFEQGRFIEFERGPELLGRETAGQSRPEQFRSPALRILSRAAGRLRGLQGRRDQLSRGIHVALLGDRLRFSRRQGRAGEEGGAAQRRAVAHAGLVSQHPPRAVQGPARPRGDRPRLRFRLDQQERDVLRLQADRLFLPEHRMEAKGSPGPDELKLLEPFRDKLPPSVFGDPYVPPESDGSGCDRKLLKQANELLLARRLQARRRSAEAAERQAADHRIPRLHQRPAAAYDALHPESRQARHPGEHAHRRRRAIQEPHRRFRFRRRHRRRSAARRRRAQISGGVHLGQPPRRTARAISPASPIRSSTRWSRRSPRRSRAPELNSACRALDRVLRAGHYWVPMWYRDTAWVAYWDAFSRPERQPKLGVGAPGAWWWDEGKAKRIGL